MQSKKQEKIKITRQFVCFFHFVSWFSVSFGFSLYFKGPNLEIHIPFGFIKIGFEEHCELRPANEDKFRKRTIGLQERW